MPGAVGPRRRYLIGLDFLASYPRGERARALAEFNRRRFGFEGALPDNYGWKHAELAAHLNQLREKYVNARGGDAVVVQPSWLPQTGSGGTAPQRTVHAPQLIAPRAIGANI